MVIPPSSAIMDADYGGRQAMSRFSGIASGLLCAALLLWPAEGLRGQEGPQRLTLEEYVRQLVRGNPLVEEARLSWLIEARNARAEWGAFEPRITGSYNRGKLRRENNALQYVQQLFRPEYFQDTEEYALGVEGRLPTGGTFRLGYSLKRTASPYAEEGEYESFAGLSGEQPLLKGLLYGAPLAAARLGLRNRHIAFHELRRRLMDMISQAEAAYWSLAFAQEARRMAEESTEIARGLVRDAEERVQAGLMSRLDLEQAQAELATRVAAEAEASQQVRDAMTDVKLLLAHPPAEILAVDPLVAEQPSRPPEERELQESLEWARLAEPDYARQKEELLRQRVLLRYRRGQLLPELNLKGSYGLSGLGASAEESLEKLQGGDYPNWSVELELRLPVALGIRERNELEAAALSERLAAVRLAALEKRIRDSVATLLQRVATSRMSIENARRVAELKRKLLDVEVSRLEQGMSDIRRVYDAEESLRDARRDVLDRMVRYRQAVMELALVRGSVLRDRGLERLQDGQVTLSAAILSGPE